MDNLKIIEVCEFYRKELPLDSKDPDIQHILEMLNKIPGFLDEGRKEKVNRWLGFIQGVLCTKGIYSIEDLKDHNRP